MINQKNKKIILICSLIIILNTLTFSLSSVLAQIVDYITPTPPSFTETDKAQTQISHYKDRDGSYRNKVYIEWTPPTDWGLGNPKYHSLFFVPRISGQSIPTQTVSDSQDNYTFDHPSIRSGTIYDINIQAHGVEQVANRNEIYDSPLSNTLSIMTDIEINAIPISENSINVEWDDVIYNGDHIGYELYISTNKDFTNINPIYINQDIIGENKVVKPISVLGKPKLSYTHRINLTYGTVYYVKIKPIIPPGSNIIYNSETETTVTYTYIVAQLSLFSTTGSGQEIWKLNWTPITGGSISEGEQVIYKIVKTDMQTGNIVLLEASSSPQYLVFNERDKQFSYRIEVNNFKTQLEGEYHYINIYSDWLKAEIQDTPYTPTTPTIESQIGNEVMETTEDSITLLWESSLTIDGEIDNDIWYDIWLLKDLTYIDYIVGSDASLTPQADITIRPNEQHYIRISETIVGYKYIIDQLEANTVYYIVIKAKKLFQVENEDGLLETRYFSSAPALRAVITSPGDLGGIEAIPKPPFGVKIYNNQPVVDEFSVTVIWDNEWYEIMHKTDDENWVLVTQEEYNNISEGPDRDQYNMRHVEFDENVEFTLTYTRFTEDLEGVDIEEIRNLDKKEIVTHIGGINNDTTKIRQEYTITDLTANTEYLIWIKAVRSGFNSDISNPITIITSPDYTTAIPKPPVQIIHNHTNSDTYIDLTWWSIASLPNKDYTYYLKYAEEDDISKSIQTITIDYADLLLYEDSESFKQFFRINDLKPQTGYYFWIMAEAGFKAGDLQQSDWSDSYYATTLYYSRPETPKGFGIKKSADGLGKNHLFYEWIAEEDLNYILEVSEDPEGKNKQVFNLSNVSEYKVEGLKSNNRYYGVLYAYNPITDLKSYPTETVSIRTNRSDDEYDSDGDNETVIDWDIIESWYEDGTWINEIIGVNADRFIDMVYKDNYIDYVLDLSELSRRTTTKRLIRMSYRVFDALSQIKENLIINIGSDISGLNADRYYIFRPNTFKTDLINIQGQGELIVNIELNDLRTSNAYFEYNNNLTYKSGITELKIWFEKDNLKRQINEFENDIKVVYPFREQSWAQEGQNYKYVYQDGKYITTSTWDIYEPNIISAYTLDERKQKWLKQESNIKFSAKENWGYAEFTIGKPCKLTLLKKEWHLNFYDIQNHWAYNDIQEIFSLYEIASMEKEGYFHPNNKISIEEGIKLLLDILDYKYHNNHMEIAYKSGLAKDIISREYLTRQEVSVMLMKLYQIKTGQEAISKQPIYGYNDLYEINNNCLPYISYALQIGVLTGTVTGHLEPNREVTRAEFMVMLKRTLQYAGEIN